MPKQATTDEEIENCYDVMAELRPHIQREQFSPLIRRMQAEGYRLAYLDVAGEPVAVAGYRVATNLFYGKHLYVDDLVTAQRVRSQGHGQRLIDWLRDVAWEEGCRVLHLDSGTHRGRAHKFYFGQGMTIASYHFCEELC